MHNFKLTIAYDGTEYHGWQIQPGQPTVQGVLSRLLARLTQQDVIVQGAGRTDSGVHAWGQVASFKTHSELTAQEYARALNALLPAAVRIRAAEEVGPDFHARWMALAKTYRYHFYRAPVLPPFRARYVLHQPHPLDFEAMARAARAFEGEHDFTAFAGPSGSPEDDRERITRRCVYRSEMLRVGPGAETEGDPLAGSLLQPGGEEWVYIVRGKSFLRHMVRRMGGTLLEVGRGRLAPSDVPRLLEQRDRNGSGPTLPPHGLCLISVEYPDPASSLGRFPARRWRRSSRYGASKPISSRMPPMGAPAAEGGFVESRDPATGEIGGRFPGTPASELPAVIERARRAQAAWAGLETQARCAQIGRFARALYDRRDDLAQRVTWETGKPRVEALFGDVLLAIDAATYYARQGTRLLREQRVPHHNLAARAKTGRMRFEPFGVIGVIAPWNYPLAIPLGQVVAALLAGNAVVLKPSELVPATGAAIVECFEASGFPPDVVQVIQGGPEAGAALIEARPDKVVFTGSVPAGRKVAAACARQMIPSVLELGGKDVMIVLADADLEAASSAAVWGAFTNGGQACLSVERVCVEQGIAARFTERCVEKARRLRPGPGSDPESDVGPMIRPEAADRIEALLAEAVAGGARVLAGGTRRRDLGESYFEPTVVAHVEPSMRLAREEIFGPVVVLETVADAGQAVARANDSPFGLAASIWTSDSERGRRLASRLQVGAVMVNDVASYFGVIEAPHGGRKASGWGRTHSRIGLLEMVQVKYVDVDWLPHLPKAWWYGYGRELEEIAGRWIEFLCGPGWWRRWSNVGRVVRALWRGGRV